MIQMKGHTVWRIRLVTGMNDESDTTFTIITQAGNMSDAITKAIDHYKGCIALGCECLDDTKVL
jgi:hypothetical protein